MSDIDKKIDRWRSTLANTQATTDSDIYELESHLREEMEHLKSSGLSDEEAFLIAQRRLGHTSALEEEFAKVATPRRLPAHLWWVMAGALTCVVATHFAVVSSQMLLAITQWTDLPPYILTSIAIAVRISVFCAVCALVLWLGDGYSQPMRRSCIVISKRVRMAFLVALLIEVLGFAIIRAFGAVAPLALIPPIGPQGYVPTVAIEPIASAVWRLAGPVVLGILLIVMQMASYRETSSQ